MPDQNPSGLGNFVFNLRFPGQYYDQETGLFYNYFRDYNPATGRYIESDPIGLNGGINTYGYVGGNPVNVVDPLGLKTCIFITRNSFGFGNHAAFYADRGDNGNPYIYDPAGSYAFSKGGGSGEMYSGDDVNFEDFSKHQKKEDGSASEKECKNTSAEEEKDFHEKASQQGGAPTGGFCSFFVSNVLGGSKAFPNVKPGTWLPGNLIKDAK